MSTCGNDKLLFVHVPKTGGSWVSKALKAGGVEIRSEGEAFHPRLDELDSRGRFTFAFVREPLSWYGSTWSFKRQQIERGRYAPGAFPREWHDLGFPDFLAIAIEERLGFLSRYYERFVGPSEDQIDFIGRYESLPADLVRALELAGEDFCEDALRRLPPVNVSRPAPECPEALRDALRVSEAGVYERFYSPVLA